MKGQSYIVTLQRKDDRSKRKREHVSARCLSEAALVAEGAADNLWEVVAVELLR